MGFRTIIIKDRCKLDLKTNYLVCRNESETRIYIPEISTLILESTAISLTSALVSELIKNNTKIIFCDEKHNPESEVVAYYGDYNNVKKINSQVLWKGTVKSKIWGIIVKEKIKNQARFLAELNFNKEFKMLNSYMKEVQDNDVTNREGHAAKVYFNALFGLDFERRDSHFINTALNYGYSIILSCFNRAIVMNGYLTQLGIWHKNEYNYFNLGSDFMEPFRPLIDRIVYNLEDNDQEFKRKIIEVLNLSVKIHGKRQILENAINIYCQSLFDALRTGDVKKIKFYEL